MAPWRRCTSASTAPTSLGVELRPDDATPDDALWRYANRTKKVVVGSDDGLRELARTADVVVVDLPATELEAAGLGAAQLRQLNPSLIHAWMPPHAVRGPAADLPYDELLLWAWTGLAAQQPGATSDHPVAPVVPIITYEQGALGAVRDRGGAAPAPGARAWCARSRCRDSTR